MLTVEAGGSVQGDCLLQCVVNGTKVGEYVLDGTKWSTCSFDLSPFLGKPMELELWNAAGGKVLWSFENCFINNISFKTAHGADQGGPPRPPSGQEGATILMDGRHGAAPAELTVALAPARIVVRDEPLTPDLLKTVDAIYLGYAGAPIPDDALEWAFFPGLAQLFIWQAGNLQQAADQLAFRFIHISSR